MWISEDQRDPNFKPPTNRPGVTLPLYKGKGKKRDLGAGDFILYCIVSFLVCLIFCWLILSVWFRENMFIPSIFFSFAPGIIIGAIIFNTQKHSSNNIVTPTTTNNQEAPRVNSTTTASDKLLELKKLRDQDLITAEEFDKMKQEILKGLK